MEMWRLWIDTGGTFTDALALDPGGRMHRAKVLSSSALRGKVSSISRSAAGWTLGFEAAFEVPEDFALGAAVVFLGDPEAAGEPSRWRVRSSRAGELDLEAEDDGEGGAGLGEDSVGRAFELRFDEEAPILAARLITASASAADLPPMSLRLATTRGTNALLERQGARTVLFITRGFADLLVIGDQQRPDLFALRIDRPAPLYDEVIEVPARRDAHGTILQALDLEALGPQLKRAAREFESAAVALMHSFVEPSDERAIEEALQGEGLRYTSSSAALSPTEGYLSRARTAVVDAYLQPVIGRYLERIRGAIGDSSLRVMTSAGGLVGAQRYRAKDSLLSGPAGGVVGARAAGRRLGLERLVAFDMGGTSTDVSRFDGDFEYRFEQRVGDAQIAAPTLAIETVAAGGGSICRLEGRQLKVGPESAGASPGPACYGAGGPLTLTDVNLLLGRLDEERFEIPLSRRAAEATLDAQLAELETLSKGELLLGYLAIADQRMADAVRQISVRKGYDPRGYALIAFGGAGGQHACSVAELIGIEKVVLPPDAGLLSAFGLGAAVIERFATRQILRPLSEVAGQLQTLLDELASSACSELLAEGIAESEMEIRRRLVYLRLEGQESSLEIAATADPRELEQAFFDAYNARFGYHPRDRTIELESLRVVVSERPRPQPELAPASTFTAKEVARREVLFEGESRSTGIYWLPEVKDGALFEAPALIFDQHASLTLPPGWQGERRGGAVVATRIRRPKPR